MKKIKAAQIFNGIWKFLNSRLFTIGLIVLLFIFLLGQCNRILDYAREIDKRDQNIAALTDSLEYHINKNKEIVAEKSGYIATISELKTENSDLWRRVRDTEGKVLSLTNTVIRLRVDSAELAKNIDRLNVIIAKLKQVGPDQYEAGWSIPYKFDNNNSASFSGKTLVSVISKDPFLMRHDTTYMTSFTNQIDVTYGQSFEDGKLRVFIRSAYPGFSVKSMQGVLIDPKDLPGWLKPEKQHWMTGFGTGPSITAGWNIIEAKPAIVIGWSLHYNIYNW